MKILIIVYIVFEVLDVDNETEAEVLGEEVHDVRSRRYDIHNSNEFKDTLNNMAADIELQIELKQFRKSKLRVKGIDKNVVHYDRYNPIAAART